MKRPRKEQVAYAVCGNCGNAGPVAAFRAYEVGHRSRTRLENPVCPLCGSRPSLMSREEANEAVVGRARRRQTHA